MTYGSSYFQEQAYNKKGRAIIDLHRKILKWAQLPEGSSKTALDIGAAYGYTTELLRQLKYQAVGLDISSFACSRNVNPIIRGGSQNLPIRDGALDLVTCFDTVEHLAAPEQLIDETFRTLRPSGRLIMSTPTKFGNRLLKACDLARGARNRADTEIHPSVSAPNEWAEKLKTAMFADCSYDFFTIIPTIRGSYRLITNTPSYMSTHILLRAAKL
jgi:SAM-dependent methyltransferase